MANRRPTDDTSEEDALEGVDDQKPGRTASHGSLSDNLVFAAVDSPRRRLILEALDQENGEADIDELVDDVETIERQSDTFDPEGDRRELLEAMYDADLPELSDIGVVDFDESSGTVRLGPYADPLDLENLLPDSD